MLTPVGFCRSDRFRNSLRKLRPLVGNSSLRVSRAPTSSEANIGDHPLALMSLVKTMGNAVPYSVPVTADSPVLVTLIVTSLNSITSIGGSRNET